MNRSKTLEQVIKQMEKRELLGLEKYGTTVDRDDLTLVEWLEHAKEEAMDQVLYLQAAINNLKQRPNWSEQLNGKKVLDYVCLQRQAK